MKEYDGVCKHLKESQKAVTLHYMAGGMSALEFAASQSSFSYSEPGEFDAGRIRWLLYQWAAFMIDICDHHPSSSRIPRPHSRTTYEMDVHPPAFEVQCSYFV